MLALRQCTFLAQKYGHSLDDIAKTFSLSYSGVSSAIRVLEKKINNQQELKNIIAAIVRKIDDFKR